MHFNMLNPAYNGNFLCVQTEIHNHHLRVGKSWETKSNTQVN